VYQVGNNKEVILQRMANEISRYAVALDLLIAAYAQFVIMLTEFKKVLSVRIMINASNLKQGVCVYVSRLPQSYRNKPYKNYEYEYLIFLLH